MTGMTGNVPYYGGRFTPAQAYAAAHPSGPRAAAPPPTPARSPVPTSPARPRHETLQALDDLLASGIVTQDEYDGLRARVDS